MAHRRAYLVAALGSYFALAGCGDAFSSSAGAGGAGGANGTGGNGAATSVTNGSATDSSSASMAMSSSGVGGQPQQCPDGQVWVPPIEPGWFGPVVASKFDNDPDLCPDGKLLYKNAVETPGSSCACSCDKDGSACSGSITTYTAAACSGSAATPTPLPHATCVDLSGSVTAPSVYLQAPPANQNAGCLPQVVKNFTNWHWSHLGATCPIGLPGVDNQCAQLPSQMRYHEVACVTREGSHACPAGYGKGCVLVEDADDDRACTNGCSCLGTDVKCGAGSFTSSIGPVGCGDGAGSSEGCRNNNTSDHFMYQATITGTCAASGNSTFSGEVSDDEDTAVTVCCNGSNSICPSE